MKKKTAAAIMAATLTFAIMLTGCGNSGGQDDASGSADTRTEGSQESGSGKKSDNSGEKNDGSGNDKKEEEKELIWKNVGMVEYISGKAGNEVMEEQISRKEEGTYDKNGNLLTMTASLGEGAEELYNPKYYVYRYEYAYDDQGREIEEKKYDADGKLTLITKTEYSDDGLTITKKYFDADGNASADGYGRLQRVYEFYDKDYTQRKAVYAYKKVEGSDEPFLDEEEQYDEHGNRILTVNYYSNGSKSESRRNYTYDEHGAKLAYDSYWKEDVPFKHEEYQVFYDEKTDEWISQTTLSIEYYSSGIENSRTVYSYNANGQLQNRLITTDPDQTFKSELVGEFDADGRLISTAEYRDRDHTVLDSRKLYEYDAAGNQIRVVEESYYQGEVNATSLQEYDALGRILKEQKKYRSDDYYSTWKEYTYEKDYEQYKTYKDYYHDVLEKECEVSFDEHGNILEETERTYAYDAGELIGETLIRRVYEWKAFEVK